MNSYLKKIKKFFLQLGAKFQITYISIIIALGVFGGIVVYYNYPTKNIQCNPCIYTTNQVTDDVTVINGNTNQIILHLPAGSTPQYIIANGAGSRIYVSTHQNVQAGLVTVYDTINNKIVSNIHVGKNPTGLALNPGGNLLYVINSGDNTVSTIDVALNTVTQTISVDPGPAEITVSPDAKRIYITYTNSGVIRAYDAATLLPIGNALITGVGSSGITINAQGTRLYVADFVHGKISVIDTTNWSILNTFAAGNGSIGLGLSADGTRLYSANFGFGNGNTVSIFDTSTYANLGIITTGKSPHSVVAGQSNVFAYTANQGTNDISVITMQNNSVLSVPVGISPFGIALVSPGTTKQPDPPPIHIASAINGLPVYDPGNTSFVKVSDIVQFTVRLSQQNVPATVRYYLDSNFQFVSAKTGNQITGICQEVTPASTYPNGVLATAKLMECTLPDAGRPLLVSAKVQSSAAPRDNPFAATVCIPPAYTDCTPVRVSIAPDFKPGTVNTIGPQRTAIVLVNSPAVNTPHPYADKAVVASIFYSSTNPKSARSFYLEASYGLMTITGKNPAADGDASDIYGPYTNVNAGCDFNSIALADSDIDYTKYERVIGILNNPDCGGGGNGGAPHDVSTGEGLRKISTLDIYNSSFGETTLNGKIGDTTLHEYGHMLSLDHGAAYYCKGSIISSSDCFADGFMEPITLPSQGSKYTHPGGVQKEKLEWLEGNRSFPVYTSGTYTIYPYEDSNDNVKVLKIPRKISGNSMYQPDGYYYISYRKPSPPWDYLTTSTNFGDGISIHMDEKGYGFFGALLDATPGTITGLDDIKDGALLPGKTFTDNFSGISVTLNSVSSSLAVVQVDIQPRSQRFVQLPITAQTIASINPADVGTIISGNGLYNINDMATLQASAKNGWQFIYWYDYKNGVQIPANPYSFSIANDQMLWATFKPAPPSNDNFGGAQSILNLPVQYSLFAGGANYEANEPFPKTVCGLSGGNGATIWYKFLSGANKTITMDVEGSQNAIDMAVYTGNSLPALIHVPGTCLLYPDQNPMTFQASANIMYYIQADTHGANSVITFLETPVNNDFQNAKNIGVLPANDAVLMRGANFEIGEPPTACNSGPKRTVWYSYTAASSGILTVTADYPVAPNDFFYNPSVAVYTGMNLNSLNLVGCNWIINSGQKNLTIPITQGVTYHIQVTQFWSDMATPTTVSISSP